MELPPYLLLHRKLFFLPSLVLLHLLRASLVCVCVVFFQMQVTLLLTAPVLLPFSAPAPFCCSRHYFEVQCFRIAEGRVLGSTCGYDDVVPASERHAYHLNTKNPCTMVTHIVFLNGVCPWMTAPDARNYLQMHCTHYINYCPNRMLRILV